MCINLRQTGSVVADSDHLQLIKFWQSCDPGKGSAVGQKILACSVCVSEHFFILACGDSAPYNVNCLNMLGVIFSPSVLQRCRFGVKVDALLLKTLLQQSLKVLLWTTCLTY